MREAVRPTARLRRRILLSSAAFAIILLALATWFNAQLRSSLPQLEGVVAGPGLSAPVGVERDPGEGDRHAVALHPAPWCGGGPARWPEPGGGPASAPTRRTLAAGPRASRDRGLARPRKLSHLVVMLFP